MGNLSDVEIFETKIGGNPYLCVDGRSLHHAMGIRTDFSTWFKRKAKDFHFIELEDYWAFHKKPPIGRPYWVVYMTLNMAKEICLTERTEIGTQIRRELLANTKSTYSGALTAPKEIDMKH